MTQLTGKSEPLLARDCNFSRENFIASINEAVLERKIAPYRKHGFYQDLFLSACFEGKKEQATIMIESFMVGGNSPDIGMMNYKILKVDNLEALKIYASLVDMNAPSNMNNSH